MRWSIVACLVMTSCFRSAGFGPPSDEDPGEPPGEGDYPAIAFAASASTVAEAIGTVPVTIAFSTPAVAPVQVSLTLTGDARLDRDYHAETTYIAAAGDTEIIVNITVVDEGLLEPTEQLTITLAGATNATLGAQTTFTLTIEDDDRYGQRLGLGKNHSCVVTSGVLRCFGANDNSQFADDLPVPTTLTSMGTNVLGVASSGDQSAVISGGAIRRTALSGAATQFFADGGSFVAAGIRQACAVVHGAAHCWGVFANRGELGHGLMTGSTNPVSVIGLTGDVTAIAAGSSLTCTVVNGGVWCFGSGYGSTPVAIPELNAGVEAIATNGTFSCAVKDAELWCWGDNVKGSIGLLPDGPTPAPVPDVDGVVTDVEVGDAFTCYVIDGGVECLGDNREGQLGDGSRVSSLVPAAVVNLPRGSNVVDIECGAEHACALTNDGVVHCWGAGGLGQLGPGLTLKSTTPVSVIGASAGVTLVGGGFDELVCASIGGQLRCFGDGSEGGLGPDFGNQESPVAVPGVPAGTVSGIATMFAATCAIVDGAVWCWGTRFLGDGRDFVSGGATVQTIPSGIEAISAGRQFACALGGGQLSCWGADDRGQLGNGDAMTSNQLFPAVVPALSGVTSVATGGWHVCAATGSTLRCWGRNIESQVGQAGNADVTTPTVVAGLPNASIERMAAGDTFTCVVLNEQVWCFGGNDRGQLGRSGGTTSTPGQVAGLPAGDVTALAAGENFACAVVNGNVYCWGDGKNGTLGVSPAPTMRASAALVTGLGSGTATAVALGWNVACAIHGSALSCWGANNNGQLGAGLPIRRVEATPVSDL